MPIYGDQLNEYVLTKDKSSKTKMILNSLYEYLTSYQIDNISNLTVDDWRNIINDTDENINSPRFSEAKKVYKDFLNTYQYPLDTLTKCRYIPPKKYFRTFDELLNEIGLKLNTDEHLVQYANQTATNIFFVCSKYTNTIAYLFLSWLGMEIDDILQLETENIDIIKGTINIGNKHYDYSDNKFLMKYFSWFVKQVSIVFARDNGMREYSLKGDKLLRSHRGNAHITSIANMSQQFFGISHDNISDSVLFNEMLKEVDVHNVKSFYSFLKRHGKQHITAKTKAEELMSLLNKQD